MGKCGSADFSELKEFAEKLQELEEDRASFCERCTKALAGRLLALVIPRTPVGDKPKFEEIYGGKRYKRVKGKSGNYQSFLSAKGAKYDEQYSKNWDGYIGGTLRRGWTGGTNTNAASFANTLPIYKNGDSYTIIVQNPVEYASYVEFGHRQTPGRYVPAINKKLKSSWVPGKFMLTISEKKLESIAPKVLEREIKKFLEEALDE